jgi:Flp pilus assembly protein TadG
MVRRRRNQQLLRRGRGSRGGATVELMIAVPLLMLLVFGVIQFALWSHAVHVARSIAAQALASARVQGGSVASGQAQAALVIDHLGRGVLVNPQVEVTRSAEVARVEVRGAAEAVLPGLRLPVHAEVQGPVEKFRPPTGG